MVPVSPCGQSRGLSNLSPCLGSLENPLPLSGPQTPSQTLPPATAHTADRQAALPSVQMEAQL